MTNTDAATKVPRSAIARLILRGVAILGGVFLLLGVVFAFALRYLATRLEPQAMPDVQWLGTSAIGWAIVAFLVLVLIVGALFVAVFAIIRCCGCDCAETGKGHVLDPRSPDDRTRISPALVGALVPQLSELKSRVQALEARLETLSAALLAVKTAMNSAGTEVKAVGDALKILDLPQSNQGGINLGLGFTAFGLPSSNLTTSRPFSGDQGVGTKLTTAGEQLKSAATAMGDIKDHVVDPMEQAVHNFASQLP